MRLVVVLACLVACSLAATWYRELRPCRSPTYLVGIFKVTTQIDMERVFYYDAELQHMAFFKIKNYTKMELRYDYLLDFRKGVMYDINMLTSKCTKRPLKADYQPVGIPDDAHFVGYFNFGGASSPGGGYGINIWNGQTPGAELYTMFVSESGCLPIITKYNTREFGEVSFVFIDNYINAYPISVIPQICRYLEEGPEEKPVDLLSLILKNEQWHFFNFKK